MADSPRWCDHCQAWGDHHTDRCRETTVDVKALRAAWGPSYKAFAEDWMADGINDDYTGPAAAPRKEQS